MISLVGMPGGGKSTIGRQLAKRLRSNFVDTDAVFEQRMGMSIKDFFSQRGEVSFREHEQAILSNLLGGGDMVLATGGGIVLREANRKALKERSTVIYLRSSPEELYRRLKTDTHRPLLQVADPLGRLRELFTERDPLYRQVAHFVIETGRPSVPTLVNMLAMQLELSGLHSGHEPALGEKKQ